jgi:hypothetical protein
MARKEVEESHNQTDVRYIRNHPKHNRFPVRRLGLAALRRCHDSCLSFCRPRGLSDTIAQKWEAPESLRGPILTFARRIVTAILAQQLPLLSISASRQRR